MLQALAKHYPQQLYFPFKLSRGHYGPEGQGRAGSLEPLLNSPLMDEWGAALNDTTYPAQRWEGWVGRLSSMVAAGDKVRALPALPAMPATPAKLALYVWHICIKATALSSINDRRSDSMSGCTQLLTDVSELDMLLCLLCLLSLCA